MPDLARDWPVLILVGGVLAFFGYVVFKSRQDGRPDQEKKVDRKQQ